MTQKRNAAVTDVTRQLGGLFDKNTSKRDEKPVTTQASQSVARSTQQTSSHDGKFFARGVHVQSSSAHASASSSSFKR